MIFRIFTIAWISGIAWLVLVERYPFLANDPIYNLIYHHNYSLFLALHYAWTIMLFTGPAIVAAGVLSIAGKFINPQPKPQPGRLPPFPVPPPEGPFHIVWGEYHDRKEYKPSPTPEWRIVPESGLVAGTAIYGAVRSGKTSGAILVAARQLFSWNAANQAMKIGGVVFEVKGDLCPQVRRIMTGAGRADDFVELSLDGDLLYNPLESDLDPLTLAQSITDLMMLLDGKSKIPYWTQASRNLIMFLIIFFRIAYGYVSLRDIYRGCMSTDLSRDEKEKEISTQVKAAAKALAAKLAAAPDSQELLDQSHQFEAFEWWWTHSWMKLKADERTKIMEGLSSFISPFDADPRLARIFSPSKAEYAAGNRMPPIAQLVEEGKVLGLNFPKAASPRIASMIAILLKTEFQRAMLNRIPVMTAQSGYFRLIAFLCDEYQSMVTGGESDAGDHQFFNLAPQSRCVPIVAAQSYSSFRDKIPTAYHTLKQAFRSEIILNPGDTFTAQEASKAAGEHYVTIFNRSVSEAGQNMKPGWVLSRSMSQHATVTVSHAYRQQKEPIFESKDFMELPNYAAIAFIYDGVRQLPAGRLYLKPAHEPVGETHFEMMARKLGKAA
jgi:TraM recognition site of TraD and TraG